MRESHVKILCLYLLQNQTQVATSLQVFHNLGSLESTVDKVMLGCEDNLLKHVRTSLDVKSLSQASVMGNKGVIISNIIITAVLSSSKCDNFDVYSHMKVFVI